MLSHSLEGHDDRCWIEEKKEARLRISGKRLDGGRNGSAFIIALLANVNRDKVPPGGNLNQPDAKADSLTSARGRGQRSYP